MERREFIKSGAAGLAVVAGTLALPKVVHAKLKPVRTKNIDPAKTAQTAYNHFIPGKLTCGEATLMAGCQAIGIESDLIPDIALGLFGGVGCQGRTCGAITGSAMALSLAAASREPNYKKRKNLLRESIGRLYTGFKKQFGATDCRTLCGLDLTTAEGRKIMKDRVKKEKCANFVRSGAKLLAKEIHKM